MSTHSTAVTHRTTASKSSRLVHMRSPHAWRALSCSALQSTRSISQPRWHSATSPIPPSMGEHVARNEQIRSQTRLMGKLASFIASGGLAHGRIRRRVSGAPSARYRPEGRCPPRGVHRGRVLRGCRRVGSHSVVAQPRARRSVRVEITNRRCKVMPLSSAPKVRVEPNAPRFRGVASAVGAGDVLNGLAVNEIDSQSTTSRHGLYRVKVRLHDMQCCSPGPGSSGSCVDSMMRLVMPSIPMLHPSAPPSPPIAV